MASVDAQVDLGTGFDGNPGALPPPPGWDAPRADLTIVAVDGQSVSARPEHLTSRDEALCYALVTGMRVRDIAAQFGFSDYQKAYQSTQRPAIVARVTELQHVLLYKPAEQAAAQLSANLPQMIYQHLRLALPDDSDPQLTFDSPKSIKAREYLIDKVLATRTAVSITAPTADPEQQRVLEATRSILESLATAAAQRTRDIQQSPHVYDGAAAVPKAIDITGGQ